MTPAKHVIILTAEAGFGHSSAARAIAAAMNELYAGKCVVDILNPLNDKRSAAFLRNTQTDYDRIVQQTPALYRLGYEMSDAPLPAALIDGAFMAGLFEALRNMVRSQQPDAIVVVHPAYLAPLAAVFALERRHIPVITVVTDLVTVHQVWFNKISDLCLVGTPEAQKVAMRDGLPAAKVKVTGIPVNPQFSQERRAPAVIRAELGWRADLTAVLVAGSKRMVRLPGLLHTLNHSGLPIQLAIVAGGDDELYRRLRYTEWHGAVHLYNYVDNMPTLLHAADAVLCKAGGLIVSEALACGRPLLLADVIAGQETGNAEYVLGEGAADLASDPVRVLELLCHWLANGGMLLRERAENARRLGRPRAAYTVAEEVWALAERGPRPIRGGRHFSSFQEWLDQQSILPAVARARRRRRTGSDDV